MKKLCIVLIFIFMQTLIAHEQHAHQLITLEAYKLLKLCIPDGTFGYMPDHVGSQIGYAGDGPWTTGLILAGAWREDNDDVVYGYSNGTPPDVEGLDGNIANIGLFFADLFSNSNEAYSSITHFWEPDEGDNLKTTMQVYKGLNYRWTVPNAYQKMRAYAYGNWEVLGNTDKLFISNGNNARLTDALGQSIRRFYYHNLTDLYKDGIVQIRNLAYAPYFLCVDGQSAIQYRPTNGIITLRLNDEVKNKIVWEILGRMCHLLQDMTIPSHVHNDAHGDPAEGIREDPYETSFGPIQWTADQVQNYVGGLFDLSTINDPIHYLMFTNAQMADHFAGAGPYSSRIDDLIEGNYSSQEYNYLSALNLSMWGEPTTFASILSSDQLTNIRTKLIPQAIRSTATLLYWFADKVGLTYMYIPPPAHLWTSGSYVGYGAAGSYFTSSFTIGNNGGQNLFYAVNHRYRTYDCEVQDPSLLLLPYNYVSVPGCPNNMGWLTPNQQTGMTYWQYRPNIYIPANEYFRAFYNYAEVGGGNGSSNIVNIWGYVGYPPPGDGCGGGGGDEPNIVMKSNPETELFNSAFNKTLKTTNALAGLGGKIIKNHKNIIEQYPDSTIACYALNSMITQIGKNTDSLQLFINYIDNLQSRLSNKKIGSYAKYIRSQFEEDFNKRIDILDKLYKKYTSTPLGLIAIADKFYQYMNTKQDSIARLIAEEIIQTYPGSPIIQEIRVALGEVSYANSFMSELFQKPVINETAIQSIPSSTSDGKIVSFSNYPNPFNPYTVLTFTVCEEVETELSIYNITGQKIKTLHTGHQREGDFSVVWDGHDEYGSQVASGIYFAVLKTPKSSMSRKIVLMK